MKKITKKGSQVSMILSFIIFVIAIIFIYVFASSTISRGGTEKELLKTIEGNVLENLYSSVWVLRGYDVANSGGCIQMPLPEVISGGDTIAVSDSGGIQSSVSGNSVLVEGGKGFMKIYYSNLIKNNHVFTGSGCNSISPESEKKEKLIPIKKVLDLMSNFSSNYESTKNLLDVPSSMEFNLYFLYSNGTAVGNDLVKSDVEIYSEDLKFNYLSENASSEIGTLRVKIW